MNCLGQPEAIHISGTWQRDNFRRHSASARGSVRKLVPLALELGFYWGGHFRKRDGMHFELARL